MNDSASLQGNDFELIGQVEGTARTTHVFGIGGLDSRGLVGRAKRIMYNRYPLKKGQAYANVSVDFKRSYFFIVNTTEVFVSADIVQFGEASGEYQRLFTENNMFDSSVLLNDSLQIGMMINGDLKPVKVINFSGGKSNVIDEEGKIYEKISERMLYTIRQGAILPDGSYKIGDEVEFRSYSTLNGLNTGEIIGISLSKVAIRTDLMIEQVYFDKIERLIE